MHDLALAQALRNADFTAAQQAADAYQTAVHSEIAAAASAEERTAICQRALETLHGHLHLARVLRAHLAAQIQENAGSCLYAAAADDRHCWQFEA